ncbi:Rieske 2Fe-2S domain-containing protein [Paenibacillus qinlingensis]|uniref:Menaquinol-cytochrome c reductase iron-sulfur subunit n=1 Tax=Paenibacillus qinlingensis TaxID=1837343 RepID=A0ABU1NVZ1_9BACL|nr:Rieske 2Fe-2S domain-containing protein [Paenibacillus qinlingensis]MDR6551639.1 menaquinol-cytochrome c reductase iron-sulfur subunit [Paenibacillus qinlingensis]
MTARLPRKITRRSFLSSSSKVVLGVSGLILGNTALFYYGVAHGQKQEDPTTKEIPSSFVKIGEVERLKALTGFERVYYTATIVDAWVKTPKQGFVYVTKDERGALVILSPACTHLGCTVEPATEAQRSRKRELFFWCPCHGAEFDIVGNDVFMGLPRLETYEPYIIEGHVYVDIATPMK